MFRRPDPRARLRRCLAVALFALTCAFAMPHASAMQAAAGASGAATAAAGAGSDAEQVRALILDTADQVSALIKDPALKSHERRERIVALVDGRIDMDVVTKLVLAKHVKRFTAEQFAEFRQQFRQHLIATYYRNAESVKFKRIDITEAREEERGDWTVKSKVVTEEQGDNLVDYRLRRDKDTRTWRIIDITIERVSLVANFRSQFQEVLSNKDPAALIVMLTEKNEKAAIDEAAADKAADEKTADEAAGAAGSGTGQAAGG